MNDSREFQDIESNYSAQFSHFPSQPAVIPSPRSMLSRDQSLLSDTWNLSEKQGNVLGEFSTQKLRESHETIQRLTSQVQELQERMNCLNDYGEFHVVESNCRENFSHVPSQPARIPSPRSMLSRDRNVPFDTWNLSGI